MLRYQPDLLKRGIFRQKYDCCDAIVYLQVKAIRLSAAPFTIENGMLTPTMKAAREIIRRHFGSAIKALYQPTAAI